MQINRGNMMYGLSAVVSRSMGCSGSNQTWVSDARKRVEPVNLKRIHRYSIMGTNKHLKMPKKVHMGVVWV
ncbi:hypothetical protein ECG_01584 [Echinococcus granulosus]|uniref:Expressed protein n=1 Tax=Echinococcus granulosus TaxID=6210 RepID=A0A068W794_ECHGR|nr:hypothetical protein ECG_01584 [Echinococcus granulosus]CDS15486.1 expressed protein [Echinococcus granulosus]